MAYMRVENTNQDGAEVSEDSDGSSETPLAIPDYIRLLTCSSRACLPDLLNQSQGAQCPEIL